jgi:hypothetical protein
MLKNVIRREGKRGNWSGQKIKCGGHLVDCYFLLEKDEGAGGKEDAKKFLFLFMK